MEPKQPPDLPQPPPSQPQPEPAQPIVAQPDPVSQVNPQTDSNLTQDTPIVLNPDEEPRIIPDASGFKLSPLNVKLIGISFLVVISLSGVFLYIRSFQKVVEKQTQIVSKQLTLVELETSYGNPFDEKTQYVNPFSEYKSPFASIK